MSEDLRNILCTAGGVTCLLIASCFARLSWQMFRIPPRVQYEHAKLHDAVRAMNKGGASTGERRRVEDAQKLGMVNAAFYVDRKNRTDIRYYITQRATDYWLRGEYPTTAAIDAELEAYRIR